MTEQITWTESYIRDLNMRLRRVGLPQLIIENGFVYKDELHRFLGIGVRLHNNEEES